MNDSSGIYLNGTWLSAKDVLRAAALERIRDRRDEMAVVIFASLKSAGATYYSDSLPRSL